MQIRNVCLIIITVAVLIGASGLAYYYTIFLPQHHRAEFNLKKGQFELESQKASADIQQIDLIEQEVDSFEQSIKDTTEVVSQEQNAFLMKQKCKKEGEQVYQKDIDSSRVGSYFVPAYHYNTLLNTCLYAGGYLNGEGYFEKFVKDSLTNQDIISYMEIDGEIIYGYICSTCLPSNDEFEKQKAELFSQ